MSGIDLAYEAIHFERHILGEAVGCQDQTFAAVGGFNLIEFRREDDISVHPLPGLGAPHARTRIVSDDVYTGINAPRRRCRQRSSSPKPPPTQIAICECVSKSTAPMNILIGNGSLAPFGELLDQAWQEKRALHSVISNEQIETW